MLYIGGAIWIVVIILLIWSGRRHPEKVREVFVHFFKNGKIFVGIVPMALIAAGFLTPLVPGDLVARWLGGAAGMSGILVGTLVGWCLPVPPVIFYPIIAVLLKTGAGMPQLTALVAAWCVFGIHRTLPMELPLMGRYFVSLRLMSSMAFPPFAGMLAIPITNSFGFA
jgi:hypothetical protein